MANWMFKLELKDFYHDRKMSIWDKAKKVAERIKATFPAKWLDAESDEWDEELCSIQSSFEELDTKLSEEDVTNEFDDYMEALYDYCDVEVPPFGRFPRNALCWVSTQ